MKRCFWHMGVGASCFSFASSQVELIIWRLSFQSSSPTLVICKYSCRILTIQYMIKNVKQFFSHFYSTLFHTESLQCQVCQKSKTSIFCCLEIFHFIYKQRRMQHIACNIFPLFLFSQFSLIFKVVLLCIHSKGDVFTSLGH